MNRSTSQVPVRGSEAGASVYSLSTKFYHLIRVLFGQTLTAVEPPTSQTPVRESLASVRG